jgi:hypothetical protein
LNGNAKRYEAGDARQFYFTAADIADSDANLITRFVLYKPTKHRDIEAQAGEMPGRYLTTQNI